MAEYIKFVLQKCTLSKKRVSEKNTRQRALQIGTNELTTNH